MRRLLGALAAAAIGCGGSTGGGPAGESNRLASEVCGDLSLPAAGTIFLRTGRTESTTQGPLACRLLGGANGIERSFVCEAPAPTGERPLAVQLFFAGDAGAVRPAPGQTLAVGRDVRILSTGPSGDSAVFTIQAGADGTLTGTADGAVLRGRACERSLPGDMYPQFRAAFNDVRLTFR